MKVQGEFKMQAHLISGVVMDVAALKVSHSVGIDIDALRAARAGSSSIHRAMERYAFVGSIRRKTHLALRTIHRQQ